METMPRLWRSPFSDFGKSAKDHNDFEDETVTCDPAYDDHTLARISEQGFNGIWIHGLLRHIVPSTVFKEFGPHWKTHVRNMRRVIERAGKHNLKVYLYMQPPRGVNVQDTFWKKHRDVGGTLDHVPSDDGYPVTMRALCTSTDQVKTFLRESSERLCRELPDLGGVILITASEYQSHCFGRYNYLQYERGGGPYPNAPFACDRCLDRHPVDVVTEIINLVHDGVRSVSKEAHIIAWDWAWRLYEKPPHASIISGLPGDVIIMSGFEQGGSKVILGKKRKIDEYSLSYSGPSPAFRRAQRTAAKHGLTIIAKLQLGTTHELATVPNLPLVGNLYDKARSMTKLGVRGFMGCWNFGNMWSVNTAAFNEFLNQDPLPSKHKALTSFAETYFPGGHPGLVVDAWKQFALAMDSYPFSVPFMYNGPINYTLAFPVTPGQANSIWCGRSWQMDKRGDRLDASYGSAFSEGEVIRGMKQVADEWKRGARLLDSALEACHSDHATEERNNAWVCYHVFRSTWNTYRIYRLRRKWTESKHPAYLRIIKNELANLQQVLPILERDQRFGWHAECQARMFTPAAVRKKIRALKRQNPG